MQQEKFSLAADQASTRYTTYLELILAAYNRAVLSSNLNAKTIREFKKETQMLNKHFLEKEVEIMAKSYDEIEGMVKDATRNLSVDVMEDNEWSDYLQDSASFTFEALKLQSTKDALYASNFLRNKVIELMNMSDGERAYEVVFNSRELNFFYTDKIGRKINSVKYVRTMIRDYYVKSYNDLIAGAAILNGIEQVKVSNVDINHADYNKILSLKGEDGLNYFILRNEMFHPNSNSVLEL